MTNTISVRESTEPKTNKNMCDIWMRQYISLPMCNNRENDKNKKYRRSNKLRIGNATFL